MTVSLRKTSSGAQRFEDFEPLLEWSGQAWGVTLCYSYIIEETKASSQSSFELSFAGDRSDKIKSYEYE